MRTSKKLLSILLTFIMTFSLIFGGLTTAFAATATGKPTSTAADGGYFNAAELTAGVTIAAPFGGSGAVEGDTIELLVGGTPVLNHVLTATEITAGTYNFTVYAIDLGADGFKAITTRIVDTTSAVGPESPKLYVSVVTTAPVVAGVMEGGFYQTVKPAFEGIATLNNSPYNYGDAIAGDSAQVLEVMDSAGNVTTVNFTTDNTAPIAPSVTNTGYINSTNSTPYAITGTGEADATVDVTVTDSVTTTVYAPSVTVDTYGNFSTTVDTFTLAEGSLSITATQTDAAGNVSSSTQVSVIKDTVAPTATISGVTEGQITNQSVTPTAPGGDTYTVSLTNNGTEVIGYALGTAITAEGSYALSVTPTDAAGNTGSATVVNFTIDTTTPVITLLGNATENVANGDPYTDAGATASDNIDGGITAIIATTIINDVNGLGTFDNTKAATYTYRYNVSDAAGNAATEVTRTVVVAAPIPAAPSVTADDTANTVTGMAVGMEYKLDAAGYVAYDAITFDAIDLSGDHTLLVRVAAEGANPAGLDTTLTFTTTSGEDKKVTSIAGNNILLVGDYAFDLSDPANNKYDLNNFLVAANTAYLNAGTYEVYFRIGDAWYDIISDPDMSNQITDLTTINGDGLFNYMNMQ